MFLHDPPRYASRWPASGGTFDGPRLKAELDRIVELTEHSDFWSDQQRARDVMRQQRALEAKLATDRFLADAVRGARGAR